MISEPKEEDPIAIGSDLPTDRQEQVTKIG
jgi:hypothetical protein